MSRFRLFFRCHLRLPLKLGAGHLWEFTPDPRPSVSPSKVPTSLGVEVVDDWDTGVVTLVGPLRPEEVIVQTPHVCALHPEAVPTGVPGG